MKKNAWCFLFFGTILTGVFLSCTKDVAKNPTLAFSDKALYDSCLNVSAFVYYKNNAANIYSGTNGPHGAFKLRFNQRANTALTDNGKLPLGKTFPNGSMIVKEVQSSGLFAFMYKKEDAWLWGEANADGSTVFSVHKNPQAACVSCHSQSGQRDLAVSFHFY